MASELQRIVDALARRLDRAVAVDDRQLRILAYSRHVGHIDAVRMASILAKEAPEDAKQYVFGLGIADVARAARVPGLPDRGFDARVVAPVRSQGQLLGYLWLVDVEETLTDEDLEVAAATADTVGGVLHREQMLTELEVGRERDLFYDLLSAEVEAQGRAASQLVEAELFVARSPIALVVVSAGETDDDARTAFAAGLEQARRALTPRHRLTLVRPDHGVLLIATVDPALPVGGVEAFARELQGVVGDALARAGGGDVVAGVGDVHPTLADAFASYEQALRVVKVIESVPSLGPVGAWPRFGIYRLLSQLEVGRVRGDLVSAGLAQLLDAGGSDSLVETLETYLDLAGDAKATSAALNLHRASLYYRLHKIEEITGTNLHNGEDRLALHLGLKFARLAGLHP